MSELSTRQHYKWLIQIGLGLVPFLVLGAALVAIFRWGEITPFIQSLFVPSDMSFLEVTLLGLIVGTIVVLISVGLIITTKTVLPQSEGTEIIRNIMRTPSGIAVSSLGGGIVEELFFRGVLIGLFIGHGPIFDGIVIGISTFYFGLFISLSTKGYVWLTD